MVGDPSSAVLDIRRGFGVRFASSRGGGSLVPSLRVLRLLSLEREGGELDADARQLLLVAGGERVVERFVKPLLGFVELAYVAQ